MGVFFIYILKSSVCLVLFYLFFRLLLSKETFHRFNRMALLGVLFFSLLIPCIEVTTRHQVEVQQAMLSIEQLLLMAELEATPVEAGAVQETVASWIQIVLLVYLAGILFLACRSIYSLISLFRLIHSGKQEKLEKGVTLVVHHHEIAPFSWMKYIVISQKDLEENGREILIHEMAHIHHRHSIDLLLADICIFFQWFNPGAWLLKQELQNIHEYEADETVINEGVNAKEYQLLLIKKAVGTRLYSMANSFNHSKLKKRITMMLKEKSNPWARLKYLYVLPLAAIAVTAFARPEISEKMEEISAVKVNDLAEIVQEKVLQDTVKVSKDDAVVVSGVKSKAEEEIVVFEVVEQMPEYPGGMNALQKYLMDKITSSPMKGKAGGRVMVGFTVAETGKIKDVHVLQSDEEALNREAERIVSEMPDWIPGKQRGRPVPVKYTIPVRFGSFRFAENKPPLILADGKEISMEAMEKLDPSTIESLSVLKDSASIKVYGKRGANGVILVNTQRGSKDKKHNIEISFSKKATNADAIPDFPVSGTVVDEEGRPKAGVSIIVPNTNHGTITDINGHFSLKAIKDGNLWFSFIGYKPVKAPVTSTMNIRMEQEVVKLFPELSGSALNVSSGTKGVNGVSIYGIKGEQPLVIIDGKEAMDKDALSKLAPDHIKSISVLKDKSAQAVYGDKGKNGVIIVEMLTDEEYQTRQNKK
ncbi:MULTISPECIES: M56 family metallopeptidase [Bacteroides]|jgi:TonB family protein|uniref:M56 family metallopeptidase n=2 Tax=Bacteroides TaxID=816 RepID=UPI000E53ABF5|nr:MULTISPECIES: M56 family metallopeptidase [Bacteroides]QNL41209.1 TonB family protein [Bacteroides sp. M10]RGQ97260.1 TonB family protein [Bacteroides sp. AF26-7BH]RGY30858.1 TonB family protein [Bacteroides sp. OF02-3LB]